MLPRKLKQVLQQEYWVTFETLLRQGTEVGSVPYSVSPVYGAPVWSPCVEPLCAK